MKEVTTFNKKGNKVVLVTENFTTPFNNKLKTKSYLLVNDKLVTEDIFKYVSYADVLKHNIKLLNRMKSEEHHE